MTDKPTIETVVTNVGAVIVSADGKSEATITVQVDGDQELRLRLSPELIAKLEAMLAKANAGQAKHQQMQ